MNDNINITSRFNNLTEAVASTGLDLSYNEADALQTIRYIERDQRSKLVAVFADETNQIWYIIRTCGENLQIVHKFKPFFSCLSDSPFTGYVPVQNEEACELNEATSLKSVGKFQKTNAARKTLAKFGFIVG